ncbi:MAG: hypothetical protein QM820_03610 [Minicystis sp.]
MKPRALLALPLAFVLSACGTPAAPVGSTETASAPARTPLGSVAPPPSAAAPAPAPVPTAAPTVFASMVRSLSEPDGPFISDNIISNETSYLQVAPALAKTVVPGGAYIGVGPEQNFTYIALTRPRLAFILDIRRQNMVEHLLYKAIFLEATSRAHFLALLVGRPYQAAGDPGPDATLDAVLAHAEKSPPDEATFAATHARLRALIEKELPLDAEDKKTFEVTHRAFFKGQLDVRFELKVSSGRRYPMLRELLSAKDPEGVARGFLASEESFRFVQTMEREGRVIPVVGDFAGDRALSGIAAQIVKEKLAVSAFYVSNVEQYLFEPKVWSKWARNVAMLPTHDKSVFIRAYLDQGKKHPQQITGHRTATVLQRISDFNEHQAKKTYATWWEVATEPFTG